MKLYIIFDSNGKYMGYTEKHKIAKDLVYQRKSFQFLQIQKLKDEMIDSQIKHDLYKSDGSIFEYCGTYLFEFEEDDVHVACHEFYDKTYHYIQSFVECIKFIKFKDDDIKCITDFTKAMIHMANSIQDEHYSSEDPYFKCFKVNKLVLSILKKIYKGDKK